MDQEEFPPPSENITSRTGTFYNRHEALEAEGHTTEVSPSGIEGPSKPTPPVPTSRPPLFSGKEG